jgi:L-serine dehydratase
MTLFDILGPVMVGPSSSHTAGAVRIGATARKLLGERPVQASIGLYGSFAATGHGHGTDRALVAGLLGLRSDDERIPDSFALAEQEGLQFSFYTAQLRSAHPNTALLSLTGETGRTLKMQAASLGGGRIAIHQIDEVDVNFTGEYNTLIVHNQDQPGLVGEVAALLARESVNIAYMSLYRNKRGGFAVMVLETDQNVPQQSVDWLSQIPGVLKVTYFEKEAE